MMRLDKFVSQSLGITRKETKQLLRQKVIEVDGVFVRAPDLQIDDENTITYQGRVLQVPGPLYFMLNKP